MPSWLQLPFQRGREIPHDIMNNGTTPQVGETTTKHKRGKIISVDMIGQ